MSIRSASHDPLRTFQFEVWVGGVPMFGVRSCSGLSWSLGATETWEGGNNRFRYANPEKATWDPITFEYGLALDDDLRRWAEAAEKWALTGKRPEAAVKRNAELYVWDVFHHGTSNPYETGEYARKYLIFNAWVSKYVAMPKLDATSSEVAIVTVELTHEGWQEQPFE